MVDHAMDVQEAIDAPRIHEQMAARHGRARTLRAAHDTRRVLQRNGYTFADEGHEYIAEGLVAGAPRLGFPASKDAVFLAPEAPGPVGAVRWPRCSRRCRLGRDGPLGRRR